MLPAVMLLLSVVHGNACVVPGAAYCIAWSAGTITRYGLPSSIQCSITLFRQHEWLLLLDSA